MATTLREYEAGDFETLYEIDQECYPPGIAYPRGELRWFLKLPGAECLVAEFGQALAGFILTEQDGRRGHVITLDVLEAWRRRGIGSALLDEAEKRMASRGVERVVLETAVNNTAAIAFWQKHGYRTGGVMKRYYLGRVDAYWMEKELEGVLRRP